MSDKHDSLGSEDTFMNIKNDTQYSNIQEHIDNRIPANCDQEETITQE